MVLPYTELMRREQHFRYSWTERDAVIYALGLGMPSDTLDERQLAYVYENRLCVLPTFVSTITLDRSALANAGLDYANVLHGEQTVTVHKPIPPKGEALVHCRIVGAWDKGPGKGAVFRDRAELRLVGEEEPFATVVATAFGRSEGGFGGPSHGQPAPHSVPQRQPDRFAIMPTLRQQALLYRMSGDPNPLHVDPEAARKAGFPEPILHGLCTFGICQRAVLGEFCGFKAAMLKHIEVRFVGVVFPGENIRVEMWRDDDIVSFEAFAVERKQKVIGNGKVILAEI